MDSSDLVLVTGGTGFIATHILYQLLSAGWKVRTTVRDINNEKTKELIKFLPNVNNLEVVKGDLQGNSTDWNDIVSKCTYVLHTASPFIIDSNNVEQDLIKPAVEGTRSVMNACVQNKESIKNIVVTSSVAAVCVGHEDQWYNTPCDHSSFSNVNTTTGYELSKTLAEIEAWKIADEYKLPLSTVNPSIVIGPLLLKAHKAATSHKLLSMVFQNWMLTYLAFPAVDVRDVARIHVGAMTCIKQAEERNRYICISSDGNGRTLMDIRDITREIFEDKKSGHGVAPIAIPRGVAQFMSKFLRELQTPWLFMPVHLSFNDSLVRKNLNITDNVQVKQSMTDYLKSIMKLGIMNRKAFPYIEIDEFKAY